MSIVSVLSDVSVLKALTTLTTPSKQLQPPKAFLHSTAIFVLIANGCFQEFRAKAYCLSQVLAGLMRFVVRPRRAAEL